MKCKVKFTYFTITLQPLVFIGSSFRNNTLLLFLVPYPFKIEASLQNSLRLQFTSCCKFDISQCLDFESWPRVTCTDVMFKHGCHWSRLLSRDVQRFQYQMAI